MSRWSTLVLALLPILVLGCGTRQEAATSTSEPGVNAQERTEYEGTAERHLAEVGAKIDSLKLELDTASAETKAEIQAEIESSRSSATKPARSSWSCGRRVRTAGGP